MIINDIIFSSGENFYCASPKSWEFQSFIQFLITAFIAILGFGIAYRQFRLAYQNFKNQDVKKNVVKYQLDAVFELQEMLNETIWSVTIYEPATDDRDRIYESRWVMISNIHRILSDKKYSTMKISEDFILDSRLLFEIPFLKQKDNSFIPRSIADEIEKLIPLEGAHFDGKIDKKKSIVLGWGKKEKTDGIVRGKDLQATHSCFNNFENYFLQVWKVKESIEKWLNQFEVNDLNIFRRN